MALCSLEFQQCGKKFLNSFTFPVKLNGAIAISTSEESRVVREKQREAVFLNVGHILGSLGVLSKELMTQVMPKLLARGTRFEKQRFKQ